MKEPVFQPQPSLNDLVPRFHFLSRMLALAVFLIGGMVLIGWQFDIDVLKKFPSGTVAVNPVTALCFLLCAGSLWLRRAPAKARSIGAAGVLAWAALGIAAVKIAEYLWGWDVNIDEFLFTNKLAGNVMAPQTAFAFLCAAGSLLLSATPLVLLTQTVALLALLIVWIGSLGYLYHIVYFYTVGSYISMAFYTALGFGCLLLGILFTTGGRGMMRVVASFSSAGAVTRTLLPAAFLVPMLLGWMRLLGERAGLYDTSSGVTLTVISNVVIFVAIIWVCGDHLLKAELLQQKREEELKTAVLYAESVFHSIHHPLLVLDSDFVIFSVNHAFYRIFGGKADEVESRPFFAIHHGRWNHPGLRQLLHEVVTEDKSFNEFELRQPHPQFRGKDLILLLSARRVFLTDALSPRILLAVEDITLRKFQADLMQEHNEKLREVSQAKSEFLANMSHELRTPLNSVIGFSDALLQQYFGPLNEQQQQYLRNIISGGEHLLSLINDILDLSKIEAGRVELEHSNFLLAEVLQSAYTMLKERAFKQKVKMAVDTFVASDFKIYADKRRLKQIIYNLLSNAVKFSPPQTEVRIRAEKVSRAELGIPPGVMWSPQNDWYVRVSIEDHGVGIKPEDSKKLFQSFTQLETTHNKSHEGTGLGLALSQKLAELHGGKIWVRSEFGKGSTFSLVVPIREAAGK